MGISKITIRILERNKPLNKGLLKGFEMFKVRVFEAFAGIGAQMETMKNLMSNELLKQLGFIKEKVKFVNVGTSEWFIDAIISYDALHHGVQTTFPKYEKLSKKVMLKF